MNTSQRSQVENDGRATKFHAPAPGTDALLGDRSSWSPVT
jgi:hypothetical protein